MPDSQIDYSDIPSLDAKFFGEAILWPGPQKQVMLRLDPDVLSCFRKQGKGYQSTINAVLRRYVDERKRRTGRRSGNAPFRNLAMCHPSINLNGVSPLV